MTSLLGLILDDVYTNYSYSFNVAFLLIHFSTAAVLATCR